MMGVLGKTHEDGRGWTIWRLVRVRVRGLGERRAPGRVGRLPKMVSGARGHELRPVDNGRCSTLGISLLTE